MDDAARGFNASTSQRRSLVCGQRSFGAGSDSRVVDTIVDRRASQSLATAKHQDQSDQRQYGINQSKPGNPSAIDVATNSTAIDSKQEFK